MCEPSAMLPGTLVTEHEMLFWVGTFYRLHRRRKWLVPIHLKTIDRPIVLPDGTPSLGSDGKPALMRCVRELALRETRGHLTWELIEYTIGVPGVCFSRCASFDEAMAYFNGQPEPLQVP